MTTLDAAQATANVRADLERDMGRAGAMPANLFEWRMI